MKHNNMMLILLKAHLMCLFTQIEAVPNMLPLLILVLKIMLLHGGGGGGDFPPLGGLFALPI